MIALDAVLAGAGGVGRLMLFAKRSAATREANKDSIQELIRESNIYIQNLLGVQYAVNQLGGTTSDLASYKSASELQVKLKKLIDEYSRSSGQMLNAENYKNQIKDLLEQLNKKFQTLTNELDIYSKAKSRPLPVVADSVVQQQPASLPQYAPEIPEQFVAVAPTVEPSSLPQSDARYKSIRFATLYLNDHHPELAKLREQIKQLHANPSEQLHSVATELINLKAYDEAIAWFEQANMPKSHFNLGRIYSKKEYGYGTKENLDNAIAWFEKASNQTEDIGIAASAALNLGVILADSIYSHRDTKGAYDIWTALSEDPDVLKTFPDLVAKAKENLKVLNYQPPVDNVGESSKQPSRRLG